MSSSASDWNPQWLDRMYNNRLLVPGHGVHFGRWAKDSESARQSWPCQLDLAYGKNPSEMLDIFQASESRAAGFTSSGPRSSSCRPAPRS